MGRGALFNTTNIGVYIKISGQLSGLGVEKEKKRGEKKKKRRREKGRSLAHVLQVDSRDFVHILKAHVLQVDSRDVVPQRRTAAGIEEPREEGGGGEGSKSGS